MDPDLDTIHERQVFFQTRCVNAIIILTGNTRYQMLISHMSEIPAQCVEDVVAVGIGADQRRYDSKLFSPETKTMEFGLKYQGWEVWAEDQ